MKYNRLGRTGLFVSELSLDASGPFGSMGNAEHDAVARRSPRRRTENLTPWIADPADAGRGAPG